MAIRLTSLLEQLIDDLNDLPQAPAQPGQFTDDQTIARRQRVDRLEDLFALPARREES